MSFFEKMVSFFAGIKEENEPVSDTKIESEVSLPDLTLSPGVQKILSAIENEELKDLSDKVYMLAVNVNGLVQAYKQQQELLIHVATLHEELLHQLDQGKVVMVSKRGPISTQQESDSLDIQNKKKDILN